MGIKSKEELAVIIYPYVSMSYSALLRHDKQKLVNLYNITFFNNKKEILQVDQYRLTERVGKNRISVFEKNKHAIKYNFKYTFI